MNSLQYSSIFEKIFGIVGIYDVVDFFVQQSFLYLPIFFSILIFTIPCRDTNVAEQLLLIFAKCSIGISRLFLNMSLRLLFQLMPISGPFKYEKAFSSNSRIFRHLMFGSVVIGCSGQTFMILGIESRIQCPLVILLALSLLSGNRSISEAFIRLWSLGSKQNLVVTLIF